MITVKIYSMFWGRVQDSDIIHKCVLHVCVAATAGGIYLYPCYLPEAPVSSVVPHPVAASASNPAPPKAIAAACTDRGWALNGKKLGL